MRQHYTHMTLEKGRHTGWRCSRCASTTRTASTRLMDIYMLLDHGKNIHQLGDDDSLTDFVHEAIWEVRNPVTSTLGQGYGPADFTPDEQPHREISLRPLPLQTPVPQRYTPITLVPIPERWTQEVGVAVSWYSATEPSRPAPPESNHLIHDNPINHGHTPRPRAPNQALQNPSFLEAEIELTGTIKQERTNRKANTVHQHARKRVQYHDQHAALYRPPLGDGVFMPQRTTSLGYNMPDGSAVNSLLMMFPFSQPQQVLATQPDLNQDLHQYAVAAGIPSYGALSSSPLGYDFRAGVLPHFLPSPFMEVEWQDSDNAVDVAATPRTFVGQEVPSFPVTNPKRSRHIAFSALDDDYEERNPSAKYQ